ncbi:hypothetical protein [Lancefieldella rimae]|uniref:hypothetical protein n=1 Tax=Lancefieldella rimae TaxID=1383 RepID=UPI003C6EB376
MKKVHTGIVAENGQTVTEDMIAKWAEALDKDKWPSGWKNVGDIVEGKLPYATTSTETLSIKISKPVKIALDRSAKEEGVTTSAYVRSLLIDALVSMS